MNKNQISSDAIKDTSGSLLAQSFANIWVEMFPDLDLMTEVPFAFSGRSLVRKSRLRADFAYDQGNKFGERFNKIDKLLLPPGILIEIDGGVHRIKWDEDREKDDAAYNLGFKLHRLTESHIYFGSPRIIDIANSIYSYIAEKEKEVYIAG